MSLRAACLYVIILMLMAGCKTTLKSRWSNFNAYYNTYYNAQKSYETGLKKNLNQKRDYNPLQPIRIHPKPVNAGSQDFNKAIQKGADILRRYEDSKWVDNAIGLIGKSYYFRKEYFSADQKFKELFATTDNERLRQKSILWQGRVLLDMEVYSEGIAFLTEQLTQLEGEWDEDIKADVQLLLAQHHVKMMNWQTAAGLLEEALPHESKKEHRERGYFLLGQVYELLENEEAAFNAYNKVQNHYVEYRVQYLAQRKKAEVARKLGREEVAYQIFRDMVRDDKNLEYKAELDFELAQTEHERGYFERAERLYKDVLHNSLRNPSPEIAARTYYGLAEIYRFGYDDFEMAAAYYDSSSQKNVPKEKLPEGFKAQEFAESFGNYARLKSEISLQDSLLKLGRMSPVEFDSALAVLREKKIEELEQMREEQQQRQNQLVTVNRGDQETDATENLNNGFLNTNSPVVQENVKQQFYATWGDRPLADYWRVKSMIDYSAASNDSANAGAGAGGGRQSATAGVAIDISGIPFQPQEQDSVQKLIAGYEYQLGNLFFLSLNMPDSAAYYFKKAVRNPSDDNVNTVSLYSLSELYFIEDNEQQAITYAKRLLEEYPHTEYARKVSEKYELALEEQTEEEEGSSLDLYQDIVAIDSISIKEKADRLSQLAFQDLTADIAPKAQYEAIQKYIKVAKQNPEYQALYDDWQNFQAQWKQDRQAFQTLKDSARTALTDTTLSDSQKTQYQAVLDSSLTKPDEKELFPYRGAVWDTTRAAVDTFLVVFNPNAFTPKVKRLQKEFAVPEVEEEQEEAEQTAEGEDSQATSEYLNCLETSVGLEIRGGMEAFLNEIELPGRILVNELQYRFQVNKRGVVDNYELLTEGVSASIKENFSKAIEESLNFEPMLYEGQAVAVECELSFPIKK